MCPFRSSHNSTPAKQNSLKRFCIKHGIKGNWFQTKNQRKPIPSCMTSHRESKMLPNRAHEQQEKSATVLNSQNGVAELSQIRCHFCKKILSYHGRHPLSRC